jgi:hypothetical protein
MMVAKGGGKTKTAGAGHAAKGHVSAFEAEPKK